MQKYECFITKSIVGGCSLRMNRMKRTHVVNSAEVAGVNTSQSGYESRRAPLDSTWLCVILQFFAPMSLSERG